jgi:hypothetical protein
MMLVSSSIRPLLVVVAGDVLELVLARSNRLTRICSIFSLKSSYADYLVPKGLGIPLESRAKHRPLLGLQIAGCCSDVLFEDYLL